MPKNRDFRRLNPEMADPAFETAWDEEMEAAAQAEFEESEPIVLDDFYAGFRLSRVEE